MTKEELAKVPFIFSSHVSMEHEHSTTYVNTDYGFVMSKHTKAKNGFTYGRTRTLYRYKGKVYTSLPMFLEAIKDVPFKG